MIQIQRFSSLAHDDVRHNKRPSRSAAFTIVELLIIIVIIGILAAVVIVAYNGVQDRAHRATLQADLNQAAKTLEAYSITNGAYPADLTAAQLRASSGVSYNYQATATAYCLTAVGFSLNYRIASDNKTPVAGACSGVLADGSSCPAGFIVVPGNGTFGTGDFCVMKYEAKNSAGTAVSTATGSPWVSINRDAASATASSACSGCHLITEAEWMTIAENVLHVAANWSGGSVGNGYIYSGHNDNSPANALSADTNDANGYFGTGNTSGNQKRALTLSNGEVIWDFAGNVWEWTNATIDANQQPGVPGGGWAWRQWNDGALNMHGLPTISQAATAGAGSWSSAQGIGMINSNYDDTASRAFIRGGYWSGGSTAGVLALYLDDSASNSSTNIGFRVSR